MPLCILVDDHDDSREGLAEYLRGNGLDVLTASDARELEPLLSANRPDIVLLDLQLPRVDGWELARRIRANQVLREVPLVAISACVLPADRQRAAEAGFDRFLPKPSDPDVVLAHVRELLPDGRL